MAYQSLSVDTKNLHQQRRSRHGKVVYDLHAQFIAFYDHSQPSSDATPVFWQGSRDRGSLKFRFRTRDGGSVCVLLDDGSYEVCMPLDCVTYLGMLPLSNRSFTNPEDINPNDPNYALLLEKCLSNGKIVFELGVENNARIDFRKREPNRYTRDTVSENNQSTRLAAYKTKHIQIIIHHSVTSELATAMMALVIRSLKSKYYPQSLINQNFNNNNNDNDDLWYISPIFKLKDEINNNNHFNLNKKQSNVSINDQQLWKDEEFHPIWFNHNHQSPSLSPTSSLQTLSPVSPDVHQSPIHQTISNYEINNNLPPWSTFDSKSLGLQLNLDFKCNQMITNISNLSLDSNYFNDQQQFTNNNNNRFDLNRNVLVTGGSNRKPGNKPEKDDNELMKINNNQNHHNKFNTMTRCHRAKSIGTIGDGRRRM